MRGCPNAVGPGTDTDQRQRVTLDLAKDPVSQPEVENPTAVQTVRGSPELDKIGYQCRSSPSGCDLLLLLHSWERAFQRICTSSWICSHTGFLLYTLQEILTDRKVTVKENHRF